MGITFRGGPCKPGCGAAGGWSERVKHRVVRTGHPGGKIRKAARVLPEKDLRYKTCDRFLGGGLNLEAEGQARYPTHFLLLSDTSFFFLSKSIALASLRGGVAHAPVSPRACCSSPGFLIVYDFSQRGKVGNLVRVGAIVPRGSSRRKQGPRSAGWPMACL